MPKAILRGRPKLRCAQKNNGIIKTENRALLECWDFLPFVSCGQSWPYREHIRRQTEITCVNQSRKTTSASCASLLFLCQNEISLMKTLMELLKALRVTRGQQKLPFQDPDDSNQLKAMAQWKSHEAVILEQNHGCPSCKFILVESTMKGSWDAIETINVLIRNFIEFHELEARMFWLWL